MNKVIVFVLIAVVVAGGTYYFLNANDATNDSGVNLQSTPTPRATDAAAVTPGDQTGMGTYVEYDAAVLADANNSRRILFFYANWCPTCRSADANLSANTQQFPEDLVVIRVNYNDSDTDADEDALADQYGITYQHTFVQIDENGNTIARWNGGSTTELLANIQ